MRSLIVSTLLFLPLMSNCNESQLPKETAPTSELKSVTDGRQYLALGDYKKATVKFKSAIIEAPEQPGGRLGMIAIGLATGDTALIETSLRALSAKGMDPTERAPWLMALVSLKKLPTPVAREPEPPVVKKRSKDSPKAVTDAKQVQQDTALTQSFKAGDYTKVIDTVEKKHKPSPVQQQLLADAYYNTEQWSKAVLSYRKILRRAPGNSQAVQYLADSLMRLKRYDESILFYRALAENHPSKPGYWRLVGDVAIAQGDKQVAYAAYVKALDGGFKDPQLPSLVGRLGRELKKKSKSE